MEVASDGAEGEVSNQSGLIHPVKRMTQERSPVMGDRGVSMNDNPLPHIHTPKQSVLNTCRILGNSYTKSPPEYLASKNFLLPLPLLPLCALTLAAPVGRAGEEQNPWARNQTRSLPSCNCGFSLATGLSWGKEGGVPFKSRIKCYFI